MVDWLAPGELARAALKAAVSSTFGTYADKRELQAALDRHDAPPFEDFAGTHPGGLWLDFVADTGDGFDATYAVASALARPSITVAGATLPRADVLVLGGDQVYPTAGRDEYRDRFVGPFRAALPWVSPDSVPAMFALAGNHDWYDGLTGFLRLFCQQRWIGGWKTRQRRSYFALRLPHHWWLLGTDFQLHSDVDQPQNEYFRVVAEEIRKDPEARVILCAAEPSWVYCAPRRGVFGARMESAPERFQNLAYVEGRLLAAHGIRVAVTLSGDLHHYVRYESARTVPAAATRTPADAGGGEAPSLAPPTRQRITCGGGGAYTYPTHHMPDRIELPEVAPDTGRAVRTTYVRARAAYPPTRDSARAALGVFALPFRNAPFAGLLAAAYLAVGGIAQAEGGVGFATFALGCALLAAFTAYAATSGRVFVSAPWGLAHGAAHLGLAHAARPLLAELGAGASVHFPSMKSVALAAALAGGELALGFLAGGFLFGAYLLVSSFLFGFHTNELYSSQRLTTFKSFLRIQVGSDGLTIHPIGIPRVPRFRVPADDASRDPAAPWLEPASEAPPPVRIEDPIHVT